MKGKALEDYGAFPSFFWLKLQISKEQAKEKPIISSSLDPGQ